MTWGKSGHCAIQSFESWLGVFSFIGQLPGRFNLLLQFRRKNDMFMQRIRWEHSGRRELSSKSASRIGPQWVPAQRRLQVLSCLPGLWRGLPQDYAGIAR